MAPRTPTCGMPGRCCCVRDPPHSGNSRPFGGHFRHRGRRKRRADEERTEPRKRRQRRKRKGGSGGCSPGWDFPAVPSASCPHPRHRPARWDRDPLPIPRAVSGGTPGAQHPLPGLGIPSPPGARSFQLSGPFCRARVPSIPQPPRLLQEAAHSRVRVSEDAEGLQRLPGLGSQPGALRAHQLPHRLEVPPELQGTLQAGMGVRVGMAPLESPPGPHQKLWQCHGDHGIAIRPPRPPLGPPQVPTEPLALSPGSLGPPLGPLAPSVGPQPDNWLPGLSLDPQHCHWDL